MLDEKTWGKKTSESMKTEVEILDSKPLFVKGSSSPRGDSLPGKCAHGVQMTDRDGEGV
jgi:hypothetical protein